MTERRNIVSLSSPPMLLETDVFIFVAFPQPQVMMNCSNIPDPQILKRHPKMAVLLVNILDVFQQALMGLFS